jgi:hypothetical protein
MRTDNEVIFNKAYWLAQPVPVRELQNVPDAERLAKAMELAQKGFILDMMIHVWGWSPFKMMLMRVNYGYTWVTSMLQPNLTIAPGLGAPGAIPYDPKNPPPGSIKVSLDLDDYPPIDPPVPSKPGVPSNGGVGALNYGNIYFIIPGDNNPDGKIVEEVRGKFKKRLVANPFGHSAWYEKLDN